MHTVHKCEHLLDTTHVTRSLDLSVLDTQVICAKMAEPIEVLFDGQTHVAPRNLIIDELQIPNWLGHF